MARKAQLKKPLVLIIEDEPLHAELFVLAFEEAGLAPQVVMTGNEGVARAIELNPAAILLDIMLPGLSGFEVLEQLRNNPATKHTPVLVATNLGSPEAQAHLEHLGATAFLLKTDSTPRVIAATMKKLLIEKIPNPNDQ